MLTFTIDPVKFPILINTCLETIILNTTQALKDGLCAGFPGDEVLAIEERVRGVFMKNRHTFEKLVMQCAQELVALGPYFSTEEHARQALDDKVNSRMGDVQNEMFDDLHVVVKEVAARAEARR